MKFTSDFLLPNGLKDLLMPEAAQETSIINRLLTSFSQFGYQQIKPPLVEFEESLLSGPGQKLSRQTFRLMDPVSQHMMGVRADVTAQIARIAASRLADEKRPLRVSYAADVLRVNGSQLRPERQFCQVGCELVGALDPRDDVEMALVALKALNDNEISDLSIDLTIPSLVLAVFDAYKVSDADRISLETLLQKRDRDGISNFDHKVSKTLVQLQDCSGVASECLPTLKKIKTPKMVKNQINLLSQIVEGLKQALDVYGLNVQITIDLIERRGFSYQSGVSYTLFSPSVRGELGRGGHYQVNGNEEASGFTLYMDSVRQAVKIPEIDNKKSVNGNTSWEEIKELQSQGYLVSRN
jgi:ATP phosphoribosyltransferase regulatory subunit